jgi:hypothetical protein
MEFCADCAAGHHMYDCVDRESKIAADIDAMLGWSLFRSDRIETEKAYGS